MKVQIRKYIHVKLFSIYQKTFRLGRFWYGIFVDGGTRFSNVLLNIQLKCKEGFNKLSFNSFYSYLLENKLKQYFCIV